MSGYSLICCVVNIGEAEAIMNHARKYGVMGGSVSMGRGTVHSHLLQVLGLDEVRREIVKILVADEQAREAIKAISHEMNFHKPHHGIAFSMPVSEVIGSKDENRNNASEQDGVKKRMYNVIYVVVDRGSAEDVIEAANEAGARGATIVNARGADVSEIKKFFNMKIVPEKEEVFIITKTGSKDAIVEAIRKRAKIDEPGKGILFVMDVNEAYGLHE